MRFVTAPLEEWLESISAIKWTGRTFAVNFGPFPFTPTEHTITSKLAPLIKCYGSVTKTLVYADRTVTIGFALEGRSMPTTRKKIPLMVKDKHGHKCVGVLMAPFHIKMLGVAEACRFCPAIGDHHTPACSVNRASAERFKKRRLEKHAKMDKPWTRAVVTRIEPDEEPRVLEEGELG